jgi:hypothetical protein
VAYGLSGLNHGRGEQSMGRRRRKEKPRSALERFRGWIVGIAVGAVALVLTQAFTGALTAASSAAWDRVTGKQPLTVSATRVPPKTGDQAGDGSATSTTSPTQPTSTTTGTNAIKHRRVFSNLPPGWVIPRPLADLSTPPGADLGWEAREQWATRLGGIETETWVEVVVRGRSARPVLLRQMTVDIVSRAPAVRGIEVVYTGIGDLLNARYLVVDLDASPPKVVGSYDDREEVVIEGSVPERRIQFPYTVSDTSQPEVFYVNVQTKTCDCRWVLKLHWEADGKRGTTAISDNGKPFRTMGWGNSVTYASTNGEPLHGPVKGHHSP